MGNWCKFFCLHLFLLFSLGYSQLQYVTRTSYYSVSEVQQELESLVAEYPSLLELGSIGESQRGVNMPYVILTNKNSSVEYKPRHVLSAGIHGNESISIQAAMGFLNFVLWNYKNSLELQQILEESEIVILPVMNPDGTNNDVRTNAQGVDPNRNFGWQQGYDNDVSYPFDFIESKNYRALAMEKPWYTDVEYHGGTIWVIIPMWFKPNTPGLFSTNFNDLADIYCEGFDDRYGSSYMSGKYGSGLNYTMPGVSAEYAYASYGSNSMVVELAHNKQPSGQIVADITNGNIDGYLDLILHSHQGLAGKVIDEVTEEPLYARIVVEDYGVPVYTDDSTGVFHKFLTDFGHGDYKVNIYANGYEPLETTITVTSEDGFYFETFSLRRAEEQVKAAMRIDVIREESGDYGHHTYNMLLPNDGKAFELRGNSYGGVVVLDMGETISDSEGFDLIVHMENEREYEVSLSENIDNIEKQSNEYPYTLNGTDSVDFSEIQEGKAVRFIKISARTTLEIDAVTTILKKETPSSSSSLDISSSEESSSSSEEYSSIVQSSSELWESSSSEIESSSSSEELLWSSSEEESSSSQQAVITLVRGDSNLKLKVQSIWGGETSIILHGLEDGERFVEIFDLNGKRVKSFLTRKNILQPRILGLKRKLYILKVR